MSSQQRHLKHREQAGSDGTELWNLQRGGDWKSWKKSWKMSYRGQVISLLMILSSVVL